MKTTPAKKKNAAAPQAPAASFRLPAREAPGGDDDTLLDTLEVARWLGCSAKLLETWRCHGVGGGPPFIRVTARLVRYRRGDVRAYLTGRTQCGG